MALRSKHAEPTVQVVALSGFIARPGHAAAAGELVDVTQVERDRLIAMGKARLPSPEDLEAADEQPPRDPNPDQSKSRSKK